MNQVRAAGRMVAVLLLALWWGGFTFYAGRVVPIGNKVLHSKARQGAITQRVSGELNMLAVAALVVVCGVAATLPREEKRGWIFLTSVPALALTVALMVIREKLNGMFDTAALSVSDDNYFHHWHEIYLTVASVQWIFCTILLMQLVAGSRRAGATVAVEDFRRSNDRE
jgi:hypothetical protein